MTEPRSTSPSNESSSRRSTPEAQSEEPQPNPRFTESRFAKSPSRLPETPPSPDPRASFPESLHDKITLRLESPSEPSPAPSATQPSEPPGSPPSTPMTAARTLPDLIPARMLNEFLYCPRLFYYEFVEGVFLENEDVVRGRTIHARVDKGSGELPEAKASADSEGSEPPETIHSRSVTLSSERLGVIAKIDIVELYRQPQTDDERDQLLVYKACPVDYKAGAPKKGEEGNELWDPDRIQLGVQALILRDNGYPCDEAIVYYRKTRQRVRLPITPELEQWILEKIDEARRVALGPIPPPLQDSPKCNRCSLAPICLPDETQFLAAIEAEETQPTTSPPKPESVPPDTPHPTPKPPRRLMAVRDDRRPLYLNTPGLKVGRRDETLLIRENNQVIDEVRLKDINHVALFGNIQLSTQAIQALCAADIPITYFSGGGWFYGITRGHTLKNVFLRIEQFRQAGDPAQALRHARWFVYGKIRNQRTMLMRNHIEPPSHPIQILKNTALAALRADSLETLLGLEGTASNLYFEAFQGMIKVEPSDPDSTDLHQPAPTGFTFDFHKRNRRPPTDPVNALLSLAYSLLAKDCMLALLAVGFDPYVGFFHQPRFGRPALALDLMEEFRPIIADSVVLTLINKRILTPKDFIQAGRAVNLTLPARKRFFQIYEQRMNTLIIHPIFDYKVSYRRALELQARILAKTLTGEIPRYIPFLTR